MEASMTVDNEMIKSRINAAADNVLEDYKGDMLYHADKYPIPSKNAIIRVLNNLIDVIFPGYFTEYNIQGEGIGEYVRSKLTLIAEELSNEIIKSFRQSHTVGDNSCDGCQECIEKGMEVSLYLIEQLPYLRDMLAFDVKAAYEGDPAAINYNEIIFSYPGLYAITVHRIANILYNKGIELIPRIMSEYSHSLTGIDIHPGATIGRHFFIDHGTGVVIGETTVIGDNVTLYQGVTLGGKSFPRDEQGNIIRGKKRHPTIEDGVTIYAGATILGGDTVIGRNSVIGGNVWIVSSIPPNSKVTLPENQTKMNIKTFF